MSEKSDLSKCIDMARQILPKMIAEELISVQPMDSVNMKAIWENAMFEEELIKEGYEPVSQHKLIWIKKNEPT
jgi:hypothetical protein